MIALQKHENARFTKFGFPNVTHNKVYPVVSVTIGGYLVFRDDKNRLNAMPERYFTLF